ncbi:hypothetical protein ANSO36C_10740 [Nostoc cf. commune SO-36]|uniref:Uncharacterized protein n=1 Tax=Nostoc cf. commune SO-36 TaxID=449208 RepID=A0ABM7YXA4_NOSCO|nr:hypothetical protein [Nostoc commune]BDI15272.1 hypothetical protein ANSO36C_10740 [Nostoc cf. commune SO-36]
MVSNQNATDNNWNLDESRTLIQALIKDFYKNNLNNFADPIKQEGLIAAGKEISQIIILFNRLQKLINRNTPQKIWWDKIPRIVIPDNRDKIQIELTELCKALIFAIEALRESSSNINIAQAIRFDVEQIVCKYEHPVTGFIINPFLSVHRSPSTTTKVIFGLISAVFIYGGITFASIAGLWIFSEAVNFYNNNNYNINKKALQNEIKDIQRYTDKRVEQIQNNAEEENKSENRNSTSDNDVNKSKQSKEEIKELDIISQKNAEFKSTELTTLNSNLAELNAQYSKRQSINAKSNEFLLQLSLAISAGTLGSIISILIRIEEFQKKKYSDPLTPFLVGAFKPMIGGAFAVLFLALINSGIILMFVNPSVFKLNPTTNPESSQDQQRSLIFVIAFVVGFSERLAKDFIGKAEEIAGANRENSESKPVVNELLSDVDSSNMLQKQVAHNIVASNIMPNKLDSSDSLNGADDLNSGSSDR